MAKKLVILILLLSCFAAIFVAAAGTSTNPVKVVDLELKQGENTSLLLAPGSPFSIRLHEGTLVEFEADKFIHKAIFKKIGDQAVIKYTLDGGRTYKEQKMNLGDSVRWNLTTGSWFVFLNYKMYNDHEKTAVFEIGIPLIQRTEIPIKVNESMAEDLKTPAKPAEESNTNKYIQYLVGIIIVLILIIIILGPRKKDEEESNIEPSKKEDSDKEESNNTPEEKPEEKKVPAKKKKSAPSRSIKKISSKKDTEGIKNKTYYTKPKKKPFNEEDVYVVNSSEDE